MQVAWERRHTEERRGPQWRAEGVPSLRGQAEEESEQGDYSGEAGKEGRKPVWAGEDAAHVPASRPRTASHTRPWELGLCIGVRAVPFSLVADSGQWGSKTTVPTRERVTQLRPIRYEWKSTGDFCEKFLRFLK